MEAYKILRIINNNVVFSVNERGDEIILRGKGIGFQKMAGMTVAAGDVEGIYVLEKPQTKNKLYDLLEDMPPEYIEVSARIIDHARKVLGKTLDENIYVTLTDHIHFAAERKLKGIEYVNPLLWEIRAYYAQEYQVGLWALEEIHKCLGLELKEDEAGFHEMIRERYAFDYACARKIRMYILEKYHKDVGTEEMTFLTVHLRRVSSDEL